MLGEGGETRMEKYIKYLEFGIKIKILNKEK